ncbi:MAG: cytochrome c [Hyphomicrobiales bacterium]
MSHHHHPLLRRLRADPYRAAALGLTALLLLFLIAWLAGLLEARRSQVVSPDDPAVERGREIAQAMCARCHAIGTEGASTNPNAPPFREMFERLPQEGVEDTILEGILLGHPPMPKIEFTNEQASDLVTYMISVAREVPP